MKARDDQQALLRIRHRDWRAMIKELGRRGAGRRESGAFLLGAPAADRPSERRDARTDARAGDGCTVTDVVYLDDLNPHCLQRGGINFNGLAFAKLWDICDAERLVVLGDVHTHPKRWVAQSPLDAANPMIARPGHIALIVPGYARRAAGARRVGVHRYDGGRWTSWFGRDAARVLQIRRLL